MTSRTCLIVIATAGYPPLAAKLIQSARKHFCPGSDRSFLVFTDQPGAFEGDDIKSVPVTHEPWPAMTIGRYRMILSQESFLSGFDSILYADADSRFIGDVDLSQLGDLTAVLHPGYANQPRHALPYESRPASTAYVARHEGEKYYCGGIQGGVPAFYLAAAEKMTAAMEKDVAAGITAQWHDESHWNRFLIDSPPTVVLPPDYCWPEEWDSSHARILALQKNHAEIRVSRL